MSTASVSLTDLDPAVLGEVTALIRQKLQEYRPNVDVTASSVISQLVVGLTAPAQALALDLAEQLEASWSLLQLGADTPDEILDRLLSNYFISRRPSSAARGTLKLTLSGSVTTAIPTSLRFVRNGIEYSPDQLYVGVISASSILSDADRLIRLQQDGTYAMSVDVTCLAEGSVGKARREDQFELSPPLSGVLLASAEADFSGGEDAESSDSLRARMLEGISADVPASRSSIRSLVRKVVPGTVDVSVIGYGDPELTRGSNNLLGLQLPGRSDVYARTSTVPLVTLVDVEAVLDSSADKTWRVFFPRDAFPGAYSVESVQPVDIPMLGTLEIVETVRGVDAEARDGLFAPVFDASHQSAFTPYQTILVRFKDPATPVTGLVENQSKKTYRLAVQHLPGLWDIQSKLFSSRDAKIPGADCLVRAPFPCFVGVTLTLRHPSPTDVSVSAVAAAVESAINSVPFSWATLPASELVRAAQAAASGGYVDLPIRLSGSLLLPGGGTLTLEGRDGLSIPETEQGVSRRTTAFYAVPGSVSVTVLNSERVYA